MTVNASLDHIVLIREVYSSRPTYFLENPIKTATGNDWKITHSLREIGSAVAYRPSPEGVRDFLCYGFVPAPRTIFKGVLSVPPGTQCFLSRMNESIDWQPLRTPLIETPIEPQQQFWQTLCQHSQVQNSALLLSGGLDSAMVASAAVATGAKLHAYHARFADVDTHEDSDTYAARLTAQHLKLDYQEIKINSLDALYWFDKVVSALDQPLGDPVILPFYLLFREIAKTKRQSVLTGEGGDQLFGSWSMKPMLMREFYSDSSYQRERGYMESLSKFSEDWQNLVSDSLKQQLLGDSDLTSPIQKAFLSSPSHDFQDQLRWVDLQLKGMQHILPRINSMSEAWSLSLHHPFFHPDLLNLSITLPNQLKMSSVDTKVLLKMIARQYLPEAVICRRKQGMGVPTSRWFRRGLYPLSAYWLNNRRLKKSQLLNPATVKAIQRRELGTRDSRSRRWGDRLWMLCVLECWFASLSR
jgi:asparagine synthase (glutamine-hydrolysing)